MDALVPIVTARYLQSRRAIPFDVRKVKQELGKLAEEAIDTAISMTPEGQPIGKLGVLAKQIFKLPHVRGHARHFTLTIETRPGSTSVPTAGGQFEVGRNTVKLYLNSKWPPEALQDQKWPAVSRLQSMGIHEITHALDDLHEEVEPERASGDPKVYYNQPAEVRAYARQVVDEVLRKARVFRWKGPKGQRYVEELLAKSDTWYQIEPHFNRRNQQLIRQIVVRELKDAEYL